MPLLEKPDLTTQLGSLHLRNPVLVASGTFGLGSEYSKVVDLRKLGAVVVKGISLHPWEGNPPPRLVEVPSGLVNAIGLQNPGVDAFVRGHLPFLVGTGVPVIVNIWGRSEEEYAEVAARLDGVPGVSGIEINASCPNIREGGASFGTDAARLTRVVAAVRARTRLWIMPKLPPNVPRISDLARAAQDHGADAISLINSVPAMVIDVERRRPALGNVVGGLTGPAIHPVAVRLVWEAASAVSIPVVGMGGVTEAVHALELLIAGASAVAVGTAIFGEPTAPLRILQGITNYLQRHKIPRVSGLVGTLRMP